MLSSKRAKTTGPMRRRDLDKQGRGKSLFLMKGLEADKVLKIWVLADLLDGLLIAQAELMFDNHRPYYKPPVLRRTTGVSRQ